ncbi:MAG: hypothetical protein HOF69_03890 [Campylobacteraceae bacterium]|jgi:hypothetical protein|nr:hypothetical protein [Campylobacteraceae bacterium]MBT5491486.1 hypothetical protein [bacterium]MBT3882385.1 hypothetical protein [Campylobacteraceae bacterium]MBT4030304.1 hypothetical protein [Campylobacteraceae bacterium]MBT4179476.1 hypothetical protein [Campylobacteraceae bacterium]
MKRFIEILNNINKDNNHTKSYNKLNQNKDNIINKTIIDNALTYHYLTKQKGYINSL